MLVHVDRHVLHRSEVGIEDTQVVDVEDDVLRAGGVRVVGGLVGEVEWRGISHRGHPQ